jgi:hypothetical protein
MIPGVRAQAREGLPGEQMLRRGSNPDHTGLAVRDIVDRFEALGLGGGARSPVWRLVAESEAQSWVAVRPGWCFRLDAGLRDRLVCYPPPTGQKYSPSFTGVGAGTALAL